MSCQDEYKPLLGSLACAPTEADVGLAKFDPTTMVSTWTDRRAFVGCECGPKQACNKETRFQVLNGELCQHELRQKWSRNKIVKIFQFNLGIRISATFSAEIYTPLRTQFRHNHSHNMRYIYLRPRREPSPADRAPQREHPHGGAAGAQHALPAQ